LIIPSTICEHDPTIAAFENNPSALSELFTAHHSGTPELERYHLPLILFIEFILITITMSMTKYKIFCIAF
jgi:hypothetical protein